MVIREMFRLDAYYVLAAVAAIVTAWSLAANEAMNDRASEGRVDSQIM
jgi:hypothetical protein